MRLYWPFVLLGIVLVCCGGPALAYNQFVLIPEAREAQLVQVARQFASSRQPLTNPYTDRQVLELESSATSGYRGNYTHWHAGPSPHVAFYAPARLGATRGYIYRDSDVEVVRGQSPEQAAATRGCLRGDAFSEWQGLVYQVSYPFEKYY